MSELHWIEELREKAEKASKGEWRSPWKPGSRAKCAGVEAGDRYIYLHVDKDASYHPSTVEMWKLDADFIAAASPDTILKLISHLHDVASEADPAGTLRELRLAQDTIRGLEKLAEERMFKIADLLEEIAALKRKGE